MNEKQEFILEMIPFRKYFLEENRSLKRFIIDHRLKRFLHMDYKVAIFEVEGIEGVLKYTTKDGEILDDFLSQIVLRGLKNQIALRGIEGIQETLTSVPNFYSDVIGLIGPFKYYEGFNLRKNSLLERSAPAEALQFFIGLENILAEIHQKGMIHGDVKPGNIIDNEGKGVFIDFSSCATYNEAENDWNNRRVICTPGYLPLTNDFRDEYALGITFAEVFLGKELFNRNRAIDPEYRLATRLLLKEIFGYEYGEYFLNLTQTEQAGRQQIPRLVEPICQSGTSGITNFF